MLKLENLCIAIYIADQRQCTELGSHVLKKVKSVLCLVACESHHCQSVLKFVVTSTIFFCTVAFLWQK